MERRFKPLRDRGITVWISLALGIAGIVVTVLGIYEWTKRSATHKERVIATEQQAKDAAQASIAAENERLREQVRVLEQQQRLDEIRRLREVNQRQKSNATRKCIGGRMFEKSGNEWREVGRC